MTIALFWVGAALVAFAVAGLLLIVIVDVCDSTDVLTERAVRERMAPHTGNVSPSSPQVPPVADAPSRAVSSPPRRARATTSRKDTA
jgi:hypothetical protein